MRDKYRSLRQAQLRFAADADHQADPTGKEVGSNPMRGCRKERPKDVRTWRAKISSVEQQNKTPWQKTCGVHSPSEVRPPRVSYALTSDV